MSGQKPTGKNTALLQSELKPYLAHDLTGQNQRSHYWRTAIGLQAVDGLQPSDYLIATANENISGSITLDEAQSRIESYYSTRPTAPDDSRIEEADKVSTRIAAILAEDAFSFSPVEYIAIHRRLFDGIYDFAGKIRDYNITKKEWVLHDATVYYVSAQSIRDTLDYDFAQEKAFDYKGLSKSQIARHIAKFISDLWQVHAFGEGNTRATAVFAIKYLHNFGFDLANDIFAANAWYFRNSLVRASYNNLAKGIHATQEYLDCFLGNLLFGENNVLKNRDLLAMPGLSSAAEFGGKFGENPTQKMIIQIMRDQPSTSAKAIAAEIGITSRAVEKSIRELKKLGIIRRIGADRGGHWEVM